MRTDQSTLTDIHGSGLSPEEVAKLKAQMNVDQEQISQEFEQAIGILEKKLAQTEAILASTSRELVQVKQEKIELSEEQCKQDAIILEKDQLICKGRTKIAELNAEVFRLQRSIKEQDDLLIRVESQHRQIEILKQTNAEMAKCFSQETADLKQHLHQSIDACSRLERLNESLNRQLIDLKDQQARGRSTTPLSLSPHLNVTSLATEFCSSGIDLPFVKVIHDLEATIKYAHLHQKAYESIAPQRDADYFFSHNQAGIRNSVKVIKTWERNLRQILNQKIVDILADVNGDQCSLARLSGDTLSQFRTFCIRAVSKSTQNCIIAENFSGYKSHSFRAYLHNLNALRGLMDSADDMISETELNEVIFQRRYTKEIMEEEEKRLRAQLDLGDLGQHI